MNAIVQPAFADFYATAEGSIASSHGTQAQVWFSYEHSAGGFHYILATRRLENGDWSRMGFTLAIASPLTQQRVVAAWREAEEDQEWETVEPMGVAFSLAGMDND
jgi:hypothetical protein